jgi:chromosome segregation protein
MLRMVPLPRRSATGEEPSGPDPATCRASQLERAGAVKITGLRLVGFKSFVEPADLVIEPGLTGIVGPNGCGKSNLVEALRFVMGENSYKAMRGGGMDDVIFAGSTGRPGRNSAEVTLFACQTRPGLMNGAAGDALEITRRIEREAGSAYRVNGREARARDVQILFADAATGARSSALVRQGQIGEIIAAKPKERRAILEDAAGISGLHARRHEAELKLKGAEQNLERLDDVLSEIAAQLEALRRQARQAVRYRNISGEIRKAEAALWFVRWRAAEERLAEAQAALGQAAAAMAEAATAQAAAAREEAVAADRLPELRRRAAEAGAALQRLRLAAEELQRREAEMRARRAELAERAGQARQDLSREAEIAEESAAALATLDEEERALAAERERQVERQEAARRHASEAAEAVARSEAELAEVTAALADRAAERAALERGCREIAERAARLAREGETAAAERARLEAELGGDCSLEDTRTDLSNGMRELENAEGALKQAETALAAARDAEQAARGPREQAERALTTLETEQRTLSRLIDGGRSDLFPPLIDSLDVEPGYELALAAALGDDLDASLEGAAPRAWDMPGPGEADPPLPESAEPLSDHVRGPAVLARRLGQVGVVSAEAGAALRQRLAPGQRLVTREGDLWRWDGLRAAAGAPTAAAQRLEQRNRLAALEGEIAAARANAEAARQGEADRRQSRSLAEARQREAREAVSAARAGAERQRETLRQAESRAARAGERMAALTAALERIETDRAEAAKALEAAEARLAALAPADALEGERDRLRGELEAGRAAAAETRAAVEGLAQAERARAGRLAAIDAERRRWHERAARAEARTAELKQRLEALEAEGRHLDDEPASLAGQRTRLLDEIAAAEAAARSAEDAVATADAEHRRLAEAARAALEGLSAARETKAREEERASAAEQRRAETVRQIRDAFDRAPHELRELAELKPEAPLPDAVALDSRIERLRAERERLGAVNLRAEQEAEEVARRLDELTSERADLEAAIGKLRHGIHSLNREARERLIAAFDAVDGHFQSLFTHLFGGGSAELMLTESDDPLEAGLEIMARPPGKKPQVMTLLSGGEQALTALSLVFAVFLTNPSPICVLDEVDAPLDDANVERFCALLDDMRRRTDTRFLVVTHNPITMARMDRLFGVTMAERGVSQLVSVDMETAEGFREAG